MPLTVDYSTAAPWLITIPKSDLTLDTGTKYILTVDEFWELLRDFSDNETPISYPPLYSRVPATATTPSITTIDLANYQIELEDGLYSVNIINGNTNIREGEVKNQVSVNTNNTAGFVDNTSDPSTVYSHLERAVWIDTSLIAAGDGSQKTPFNTLTAAIDYAEAEGIKTLYIYDDIVIDRQLKNFKIIGVGVPTIDCNTQNLNKSEFSHCAMEGNYTGVITVQECLLLNNFWLNGFFENCGLKGDLFCVDGSEVFIKNSASAIAGIGRPTISMNGVGSSKLSVRGQEGGLTIKDCNNVADEVTVGMNGGGLTFDGSNNNGVMVADGGCDFVDLATAAGATVTNRTIPNIVWKQKVEGVYTAEEIMRLLGAALAGKASGLDTLNPIFLAAGGIKPRIAATTDDYGNRSAVTVDVTP